MLTRGVQNLGTFENEYVAARKFTRNQGKNGRVKKVPEGMLFFVFLSRFLQKYGFSGLPGKTPFLEV